MSSFTLETIKRYKTWIEQMESEKEELENKIEDLDENIEKYNGYIKELESEIESQNVIKRISENVNYQYATGMSIE